MELAATVPAPAALGYETPSVPLCAHCGLPVAGLFRVPSGPVFCCGGCALAHRITGGDSGHGQAVGLLMAVGIGAFLAMNVMMLSFVLYSGRGEADRALGESWVRWALLLLAVPALALLGAPFLARGLSRLKERALDTDALIVLGVAAAFALSTRSVLAGQGPLYLDTAMGILLFVTIGRYLEAVSRARTTDALAALVRQLPSEASRIVDGVEQRVPVESLRAGDVIRVRPGARIPVDGVVLEGASSVSEAELTGESIPVPRASGASVAAGTLALDGTLLVSARRTGAETTVARLARLVAQARAGRTTLAPLVDRLVAAFVPVVLLLAAGTVAFWTWRSGPGTGLMNGLSVLLIACPCAIGIATPLAFTAAVGRAASAGVLVRSGATFEALSLTRHVFLDKTGTLTRGVLELTETRPAPGVSGDELLVLAAALEEGSEHPVAVAVRRAAAGRALPKVAGFRALPGRGVEGDVDGTLVRMGTAALCATPPIEEPGASVVHVRSGDRLMGALVFRDTARPSAAAAVTELLARGLEVDVLSGDQRASVAAFVSAHPGVGARSELSPEEKLAVVREATREGSLPVMVGDGINDSLALSGSAVGVTLESGTDLAREVADVTILGGDLRRLPWLLHLATRTMRTAKINLFWAFFYNGVGIALAMSGLLHPLFGALAMIVSSLLVVLHSQRLARFPLPEAPA